jgi:hypothetical protein
MESPSKADISIEKVELIPKEEGKSDIKSQKGGTAAP